jgi:hypothetical protein
METEDRDWLASGIGSRVLRAGLFSQREIDFPMIENRSPHSLYPIPRQLEHHKGLQILGKFCCSDDPGYSCRSSNESNAIKGSHGILGL